MNKKICQRGNMTIELALIMPLVLSVMVLLICVAGFLYNRQTIDKIACIGIEKGLMMEQDSSAAVQKEIDQYVSLQIQERLLFHPDTSYQIKASKMQIVVEISFVQTLPIKGLSELLPPGLAWKASAKQKATRINPTTIMWVKS